MKTSKDNYYFDWQRHILKSNAKIPKECHRPTLIAFCLVLAIHGRLGMDCFASDVLIAKEIGISRRHLAKYRRVAVELGWFHPNGIKRNRVEHLDISIPTLMADVPELVAVEAVEVAEVVELRPKVAKVPTKVPAYDPSDPWAESAEAF